MTTETYSTPPERKKSRTSYHSSASDAVYGLGLIGALVFFLGQATTFWMGVLGVLKSLVWPALLVFEALKLLYS